MRDARRRVQDLQKPQRQRSIVEQVIRRISDAGFGVKQVDDEEYRVSDRVVVYPSTGFWRTTDGSAQGYGVEKLVAHLRSFTPDAPTDAAKPDKQVVVQLLKPPPPERTGPSHFDVMAMRLRTDLLARNFVMREQIARFQNPECARAQCMHQIIAMNDELITVIEKHEKKGTA